LYYKKILKVRSDKIIGTVDALSALSLVHPQAIYLHEGETFQVELLDLENKVAHLNHTESDYYTQPIHQMTIISMET
jgi:DEAD/DEAH box helicase domain-containing protein